MSESPILPDAGARLHALDNLRAILMWLGIVLHVDVIYAIHPMPNAWRDDQRTLFADVMVSAIHAFRMPAFFILAGFFASMLASSRGPEGLLRHRFARLGLPFALFWPPIWVATCLAALFFVTRMRLGTWGLDASVAANLEILQRPNTLHMWFLWMLLWYCMATAVLMRLPHAWFAPAATAIAWLARQHWGFAVLALPLLAASAGYVSSFMVVSNAFLPPWNEWLYNGAFFVFGLVLYGQQASMFPRLQHNWPLYAMAGLLCYLCTVILTQWHGPALLASYSYQCAAWLWSFATIGLALRCMPTRQPMLGYLADSAYWVYLVHLPLVILFGALLFQQPLPALLKIVINIGLTTVVCLGTYELFVRHGWLSQLLNGKPHPRRADAAHLIATDDLAQPK